MTSNVALAIIVCVVIAALVLMLLTAKPVLDDENDKS